ncbi:hypothetical protein KA977_05430 [Candidatus Dependentiae bacterium]|nr:hypothetical protein [Candidatus Dependentiae bacterium]
MRNRKNILIIFFISLNLFILIHFNINAAEIKVNEYEEKLKVKILKDLHNDTIPFSSELERVCLQFIEKSNSQEDKDKIYVGVIRKLRGYTNREKLLEYYNKVLIDSNNPATRFFVYNNLAGFSREKKSGIEGINKEQSMYLIKGLKEIIPHLTINESVDTVPVVKRINWRIIQPEFPQLYNEYLKITAENEANRKERKRIDIQNELLRCKKNVIEDIIMLYSKNYKHKQKLRDILIENNVDKIIIEEIMTKYENEFKRRNKK